MAALASCNYAANTTLQLRRRALEDNEVRPTAIAYRADGFVTGLAAGAIQQHVDAAWNRRTHLLNPVSAVIIEHLACAEVPQVIVIGGTGHADGARALRDGDLDGRTTHASGGSGDQHGFACLQPP